MNKRKRGGRQEERLRLEEKKREQRRKRDRKINKFQSKQREY